MTQPKQKLPKGWKWESLGAICVPVNQRKPNSQEPPVMSISKYDGFVPSLEYFSKQVFSVDRSKYKYIKAGQFAYSTIHLDEGSIALFSGDEGCLISPMYTTFEVSKKVDSRFLLYLLKSELMIRKYELIAQGSVNRRKSIPFEVFSKILVPLPPLPVQRWIADALGSVDRWIEKVTSLQEKQISSYLGNIQAIFERIIPECQIIPFKELMEKIPESGHSPNPHYGPTGFNVIGLACLTPLGFTAKQIKPIIEPNKKYIEQYSLNNGDFLISRANVRRFVGLTGVYQGIGEICTFPDLIYRITLKKSVVPEYLDAYFRSNQGRKMVMSSAHGVADSMVKINKRILGDFLIPIPDFLRQVEIAKIDSLLRKQIFLLESEIENTRNLKTYLLNQLLSGQLQPVEGWEAVT